jgi:hypothetical protein
LVTLFDKSYLDGRPQSNSATQNLVVFLAYFLINIKASVIRIHSDHSAEGTMYEHLKFFNVIGLD